MAETARTSSQILSLFADNTSGDIGAQDLRDFVASVRNQYGIISVNTGFNGPEGETSNQALVDAGLYGTFDLTANFLGGDGMGLVYAGPTVGSALVLNWGTVTNDDSTDGFLTLQNRKNFVDSTSNGDGAAGSPLEVDLPASASFPYCFVQFFSSLAEDDEISQIYTASDCNPQFGPNSMMVLCLWP